MSDIHKKTPDNVAKLIDGTDPNDRTGSLQAPYWMEAALSEIQNFMSGDAPVDGMLMPRFGVLSLLLRATPCFVYGHPAMKKLCKTAFTDGVHVFISDDLFGKLVKEEDLSNGAQEGLVPLMMHELMHKLFNHVQRLRSFPSDIANQAADYSINSRLQIGFPEIEWVPSLRETGLAFKPGEKEKYSVLSEESIAKDLFQDRLKQQSQKGDKGKPQSGDGQGKGKPEKQGQPGKGTPQSGQGQPGQGQPGQQPGQGGQPQPGQQDPGGQQPGDKGAGGAEDGNEPAEGFGEEGDNHLVELDKLVQTMKEAGLDAALEKLGIPDADDLEQIGKVQEESDLRKIDAIHKAAAQASQCNGKYPGAHIADAAADMMRGFTKGKLHWKLALREMIFGEGQRHRPSMEEPSSIYYIEEAEELLGNAPYLPVELPFKPEETVLCLIDTSGSVNDKDIRAFLSEIFELKTAASGFGDSASEVIVLSADTVLRGEPIEITDANCDELMSNGVKVFGRGGTSLGNSLKQAVALPMFKDKKIKSVVYFTDLYDTVPQYKDLGLPTDDVAMMFIAAPSTGSQHVAEFAKGVEGWARVAEINEGIEIDISETSMDMPVAPASRRRPGR